MNLNLQDLLEYNNKLWKKSINEYNNKINDRHIKDKMLYRQIHCKIVADIAIDIFEENIEYFYVNMNRIYLENILYMASLTHDIRKLDKKHSSAGSDFIKFSLKEDKFLKENHIPLFEDEIINEICLLIHFHKTKDFHKISEKIKPLIFIIKISDKLSKFAVISRFRIIKNTEIEKNLKECIKDMDLSKECCKDENKVIHNILEYFYRRYCSNKILNF